MPADTDTVWMLGEYAGGATRPRTAQAHTTSRRAGRVWIAGSLVAIVVAMLVSTLFTGGGSSAEPAFPFNPQAEQWKREAHLANNARLYRRLVAELDDPAGDEWFVLGSRHLPV